MKNRKNRDRYNFFMGPVLAWTFALLLGWGKIVPVPIFAVAFQTERTYHDSLAALKAGRHQRAMEGFMEVLLENPKDAEARSRLREAALKLLEDERAAMDRERREILEEALSLKRYAAEIPRRRQSRLEAWRRLIARTLDLASRADTLPQALRTYDAALQRTPVHPGMLEEFRPAADGVWDALTRGFGALGLARAGALGRPELANTGHVMGMLLAREPKPGAWEGLRDDPLYGDLREVLGAHLDRVRDLRAEERRREGLLGTFQAAYGHLLKEDFAPAVPLLEEVLREDPKNFEAAYYLRRANLHLSRMPKPAPVARAKPAPKPKPAARPEDPDALYQKGLRAYALGDVAEAIRLWQGTLKIQPGHRKASRALDRARFEQAP